MKKATRKPRLPKTPSVPKVRKDSGVPRYRAIHDALRQQIVSGAWPPGYKLPPEPELASTFGCARMTISKALGALAERGLVSRRRRAGTIVNEPRFEESVLEIHDIEAEIKSSGHAYRFECLGRSIRRATAADAKSLGVPPGTSVLVVTGLHLADEHPHAYEDRLIHLDAVPAVREEPFAAISPGRWLLEHVPWTEAEHRISALNAPPLVAQALGIALGTACLCIDRHTQLDGIEVTSVRLIYPCDKHRLVATFRHRV